MHGSRITFDKLQRILTRLCAHIVDCLSEVALLAGRNQSEAHVQERAAALHFDGSLRSPSSLVVRSNKAAQRVPSQCE